MWLNWNFCWKSQKLNFFFFYSKIELFFTWLEELNFFQYDSKNWTLFEIWFKELFLNLDSKNWTFYYLTQRVELFIGEFQFFESYSKKSSMLKKSHFQKKSILWVVLKKNQFCESYSYFKKKKNILRVTMKKGINSSSHFWVKNILKRRFKSVSRKKSNSLSFFLVKKTKSLSHVIKKGSILRVILEKIESYWKNNFISLSHIEKRFITRGSILWVIWKKFKYLSHFGKKKKKINSLSHIFLKMVWFFRVFQKVAFVFLNKSSIFDVAFKKWVRFFESSSKRWFDLVSR